MDSRATLFCLLLAAATPARGAVACDRLDVARWLLGEWTADHGERVVSETWRETSAQTWEGAGATHRRSDGTLVDSEALRLARFADAVFYLAKVPHNAYPVAFRLTECADGRLVFENPQHDFPRRLQYTRVGDDRMTVTVSDGAAQGFELRFVRRGAHVAAPP